jgi:NhaP-type Na+/H+ or K+/H+ antiporter
MTTTTAILLAGLLVFLAHLFSSIFEKSRVPDVLPLLGVGLLIGPVFHLASPTALGRLGDVFSVAALVIILFQGGLELQASHLAASFGPGVRMALLNFAACLAGFTCFARFGLHWPWLACMLLGAMAGATSSSIVIPLAQKLRMEPSTRAALVLEASFTDVLCIVATLALLAAFQTQSLHMLGVVRAISFDFAAAVLIGLGVALAWSCLLHRVRRIEHSMLMTPALVCVVFGLTEAAGFSGAIAALAFGIGLGNIEALLRLFPREALPITPVQLDAIELSFLGELTFLIKTFFFIYIGFSIRLSETASLVLGLVMAILALMFRILAVIGGTGPTMPVADRRMCAIMAPRGLTSAVLATMAVQAHLDIAPVMQNLVYGLILFSVVFTASLAFIIEKGRLPWPYTRLLPS